MTTFSSWIDLPLVLPLAEWIWSGVEDQPETVTPELCLQQLPFLSMPCLSQLVAKFAGIGMIVGACFNKTPTILLLVQAQSADGFSRPSVYSEVLYFVNASIYGILEEHPFTAYGENLSLLIQCLVSVHLMWKYTQGGVALTERLGVVLCGLVYAFGIIYWLPREWLYILHGFNDVIIVYAGGSQIWETYRVQHTGAISIATTSMNLFGEVVRVFTTLVETKDLAVLSGYVLCAAVSLAMFGQYFWYRRNTDKFWADIEREQQRKKEA